MACQRSGVMPVNVWVIMGASQKAAARLFE
jgi:hypothetical protein